MARSKTKKTRDALTYETLPALFTGICDAIRLKTGGTDPINHQDIPAAIGNISGGPTLLGFDYVTSGTYVKVQKNYTISKSGTLKLNALLNGGDTLTITKNGSGVSAALTVQTSVSCAKSINIAVTAGDTLHFEGAGASVPGALYIIGVIE